jgi:hypothetical protein
MVRLDEQLGQSRAETASTNHSYAHLCKSRRRFSYFEKVGNWQERPCLLRHTQQRPTGVKRESPFHDPGVVHSVLKPALCSQMVTR